MTKRRTFGLLMVLVGLLAGGAGAFVWLKNWWHGPLSVAEPSVLTIASGDSMADVVTELADRGWVRRPRLLSQALRLRGDARRLQAGEYAVLPGQTLAQLATDLRLGRVLSHSFRIQEGWRLADLLAALAADERLTASLPDARAETLLAELDLPADKAAAVRPDGAHGEGWFFPDTYRFRRGDDDVSLLRRAHARMRTELARAWSMRDADLAYQGPYDALILASIIEKETWRKDERAHVAQVFLSRLNRNMRLQTDPTVIYGLGDAFDGDLKRTHLRQPTPYNTYVHKGLPPTPISLPGRAALQAAVQPSGGPWLYFVARGDGSSQFSRTLAEHNAAVRKYQLKRDR